MCLCEVKLAKVSSSHIHFVGWSPNLDEIFTVTVTVFS